MAEHNFLKKLFGGAAGAAILFFTMLPSIQPAAAAEPGNGKISPKAIRDAGAPGVDKIDVIVTFTERPGEAQRALVRENGAAIKKEFQSIPAMSLSLPTRALDALAHNPAVKFIAADAQVTGNLDIARGVVRTVVPVRQKDPRVGSGVTVAVLDSGYTDHYDLYKDYPGEVIAHVDMTGGNDSDDHYGHGTHVAGIIAGRGYTTSSIVGVSPGAAIASVKVLDDNGSGSVSNVIAGIDWVLANKDVYGIRVANLSLGHRVYESASVDPLVQAVETLWNAGVVVVVSAGNDGAEGYGTITSPGNSPRVITVGALTDWNTADTSDDTASTYSGRGPTLIDHYAKPDLLAPGNRIISLGVAGSTLEQQKPEARVYDDLFTDYYFEMSGTSMAAAFVSSAAASLLYVDPNLNPDTVKARLMKSARKVNLGDPLMTGAGVLRIYEAIQETGYTNYAPSPVVYRDETTGRLGVENTAVLWSDSNESTAVLWSDAVIWSDSVLWSDAILWSDSVLWSDAILWSDSVLWSDAILWSDSLQNTTPDMTANTGAFSAMGLGDGTDQPPVQPARSTEGSR